MADLEWYGDECFAAIAGELERRMIPATAAIMTTANSKAPEVIKGTFYQDVKMSADDVEGQIVCDARQVERATGWEWLAKYLELGGRTKQHMIYPHLPPWALAFMWKGKMRFFSQVHHPGSHFAPLAFMRGALDTEAPNARHILDLTV